MLGQMRLLLPDEYCDAFEPMCMNAPTTNYESIKEIVETELGKPLEEMFECIHISILTFLYRF